MAQPSCCASLPVQVEVYEDVTATFDSMAAVKLPACLILDTAAALVMSLFKMGLPALAVHVLRLKVPEAQQVIHKAAAGELPLLPARNDFCRICMQQQRTEDTSYASNFAGAFGEKEDRNCRRARNLHLLQAASGYLLLHAAATVSSFQSEDASFAQADTRQALLETIQNLNMLLAAIQIVEKDCDTQALSSEVQAFAQQAVGLIARSCRCLATAKYSSTAAELMSRSLQRVNPPDSRASSCHWNIRWQLAQLRAARGEWEEAQTICSAATTELGGALNEAPAKWRRGIEHLQLLFSALLIKCKVWTEQVHPSDAFEELQGAVKRFVAIVYPEQPPQTRQAKAVNKPELESDANSTSSDVKQVTLHEHLRKLSSTLLNDGSGSASMSFRKGCAAAESKRLLLSLTLAVLHPGSIEGGSRLNKNGSSTGGLSAQGGKSHQNDEAGNPDSLTESEQVGDKSSTPSKREDLFSKGGRKKRGGTGGAPSKNGVGGEGVLADVLLVKAMELADGPLSDLLQAAEKLDAFFVAESHQAAPEVKAGVLLPAASAHDSSSSGRKKGARPSAAGPTGAPGPANPVDVVRDAVRTAQIAAASLPLPVHVELLWRVADMKGGAPAGKLAKIWNALQYRFIYMNFFSPPLLELEAFDLFDCVADGGWALRELEDKLRVGWVVASSCDLQSLKRIEEVSISVPSRTLQLQNKNPQGEVVSSDEPRAAPAGQNDTIVSQAPCARILLARYWDWEASLRNSRPPSADTASNAERNAQLPLMGSPSKAQADHTNQAAEIPPMNIEAGGQKLLLDVSNRLALVCGVQLINAESFEVAAAKYRAERQREASVASETGEGLGSQAMQSTAADRQLHAERALRWIHELEEPNQRPSSLRRLVRRQKSSWPLAAALVFNHGYIKGQEASAVQHQVSESQEEGNNSTNKGRTDCSNTEGASSGSAVAPFAGTSRSATIHVVLLRSCAGSLKTKNHQFLVYTTLSADCPSAGDADSPVDFSWWKESALGGDDRGEADSLANGSSASQVAVWTEAESDFPLCVLAIELQIWSLMKSLSSVAGASRDSQDNERPPSGEGSSLVRAETSGSRSADGMLRLCAPVTQASLHLRLRLVLEITALLTHAFATDAFDILLKHFANSYINQVLSSLWSSHVLPLAMALFPGLSTVRADNSPPASRPSSGQEDLKDNSGCETAEADELLMLERILQMLGGLMVKCKFSQLRPIAALVSLLFHSPNQPLHQPKGRDLLRGLIAHAEALVSEMAMPFVEALNSAEANLLLASADPLAHFEYSRQAHDTARSAVSGSTHKEELYQNQLRQMAEKQSLHWEAEPAEAWSLLFSLYDIEARVTCKASCNHSIVPCQHGLQTACCACTRCWLAVQRANRNNTQSANQHSASSSKRKTDGTSVEEPVAATTTLRKGKDNNAAADEGAAKDTADKHLIQRQAGRNMYNKCLALCAQAELVGSHEGATALAGALKEVSSIEELEAKWICLSGSSEPHARDLTRTRRPSKPPLLVGRGPNFLLLRFPGALKKESSQQAISEETWNTLYGGLLRTHGGLGVSRLQKDVVGTGLRFKPHEVVRIQALEESELYVAQHYDALQGALLRQFRKEKNRNHILYSKEQVADVVDTLLRQSTNLQLAVFSDSTKIVEQQLASMLSSMHPLAASLPMLPAKALEAILRILTATDALPRDYIQPSARAMEGALLGFACLAAAEFQIPITPGLLSEGLPKCLTLPTTAGAALTSLEKRVLLHSWLSSCILASSTCTSCPDQATQLLEGLPPPAWAFENRGAEGKMLPSLLGALLQSSSADIDLSVQRLFDTARNLIKSRTEKDESSILGLAGILLSITLKRLVRQADWTKNFDIDDLIMEAENVLEAAAPSTAAALHEAAKAVAFTYTRNAEPLVEWLCSRKAPVPVSIANKTTAADASEKTSFQDETLQAQQIHAQGEEFERRVQSAQVAAFTSTEREAALWMADCFSMLLAPPLQAVSVHHRTVSTSSFSRGDNARPCGLFDFERIVENAVLLTERKEPDAEETPFETTEPLQNAATSSNKRESSPALAKTPSRSGVSPPPTGSGASAPRTGVKSDKGGDESRAESEPPSTADSSLCLALQALLQRGAAAASRAVLAGAPLLAHSVIMQLGTALLVAERSVDPLSVCLKSPPDGLTDERKPLSETAIAGRTPSSKEPTASGTRENAKTDSSSNSKAGKKGDSKGHVRSPGAPSLGGPSVKGSKQQLFEGKLPTSPWAAAGMVAHSCVEVLRLLVDSYLRIVDKTSADLTSLETGHGAGGASHSALEATEMSPEGTSSDSQISESASGFSLLCQNAFDYTKINTLHVEAVFVFCIRILLRQSRWHQVVSLCRRFCRFARGPALRCALSLALTAQQKIISQKEKALSEVRAHKTIAVEAQELAEEKLADAKAAAIEKEAPES
ncbi:hypothetical protein Emed_004083 [Eimeria media]